MPRPSRRCSRTTAAPGARRIAGQAHPDLLVLERTAGDSGALRTVITVEQVRRTVGFFGSTAGEGGWGIFIVGAGDAPQKPEGPHAPPRPLRTIRSRCRRLALRPLGEADVMRAAAAALGDAADAAALRLAAAAADGSVARAIALSGGPQLALRDKVIELLARLPATDPRALHALGDSLERGGDHLFDIFIETVRAWLSQQLDRTAEPA